MLTTVFAMKYRYDVLIVLLWILLLFLIVKQKLTFNTNNNRINSTAESSLQMLVILFRHGQRTPDLVFMSPKDPYINETFYPYGPGRLTNKGKQTMYSRGKDLRTRYNHFLGPICEYNTVSAYTTTYDRTKTSLQLVLAGLFPVQNTPMEWNAELNWEPIPYKELSNSDHLLSFPNMFCPNFVKHYEEIRRTEEGMRIEKKYNGSYEFLSNNTGLIVNSVYCITRIYFALVTEEEFGLKLPVWAREVYPDFLRNAVADNYGLSVSTPKLRQLFGGFLLKKIIHHMHEKINNKTTPKMFVYSAHEYNVIGLLASMNLYNFHMPHYGSTVILELHKIKNDHYVKVIYSNSTQDFQEMSVPECENLCRFETFVQILQENIACDGNPCETEF